MTDSTANPSSAPTTKTEIWPPPAHDYDAIAKTKVRCSVSSMQITEELSGKTAREVAEQFRIRERGGVENLENIRNPVGPARATLLTGVRPCNVSKRA